jgi:hypothetical protein
MPPFTGATASCQGESPTHGARRLRGPLPGSVRIQARAQFVDEPPDPRDFPLDAHAVAREDAQVNEVELVGATGFEPATFRPPAECATRVRGCRELAFPHSHAVSVALSCPEFRADWNPEWNPGRRWTAPRYFRFRIKSGSAPQADPQPGQFWCHAGGSVRIADEVSAPPRRMQWRQPAFRLLARCGSAGTSRCPARMHRVQRHSRRPAAESVRIARRPAGQR